MADKQRLCFPVSRLEERESEMKKEYNALHQRHTEVGARPASASSPDSCGCLPTWGGLWAASFSGDLLPSLKAMCCSDSTPPNCGFISVRAVGLENAAG